MSYNVDLVNTSVPKKTKKNWHTCDQRLRLQGKMVSTSEYFLDTLFPSLEFINNIGRLSDGTVLQGRSRVEEKRAVIIGEKGLGKSELVNSLIHYAVEKYGLDNTQICISHELEAMIGEYTEEVVDGRVRKSLRGGSFSPDKLIHIFVLEDAQSQYSNSSNEKKAKFDASFQLTRHNVQHRDEWGNRFGVNIFIILGQEYYGLDTKLRTQTTWYVFKGLTSNLNHISRYKQLLPREALKILGWVKQQKVENSLDNSYKGRIVVTNGAIDESFGGVAMEIRIDPVPFNYLHEESPYWIRPKAEGVDDTDEDSSQKKDAESEESSADLSFISGEVSINLLNTYDFPVEYIQQIFMVGQQDEWIPSANGFKGRKYTPDRWERIWDVGYRYFVLQQSTNMIVEDYGISPSNITNSYNQGGYIQILMTEVFGYWAEQVIPEFIRDKGGPEWILIAGQSRSDLKDRVAAMSRRPGVGLHGEIKTRTRRASLNINLENASKSWLSREGIAHVKAGGTCYLYLLVIQRMRGRNNSKLYEYSIKLKDSPPED